MVPWSTIRPVLIQLITDLAVDQIKVQPDPHAPPTFDPLLAPEWTAEWKDRPREFVHPGQELSLTLRVTSCEGIGEEEWRNIFDEDQNDLFQTVCGMRKFTLQLQAEVPKDSDDDGRWALQTLERVRTRIGRYQPLQTLLAVDVALVDTLAARNVPSPYDRREWSIATMDIVFAAAFNDDNPDPLGWIERVLLTTEFSRGPALLPSPPNVTDEELPPE